MKGGRGGEGKGKDGKGERGGTENSEEWKVHITLSNLLQKLISDSGKQQSLPYHNYWKFE